MFDRNKLPKKSKKIIKKFLAISHNVSGYLKLRPGLFVKILIIRLT